MNNITATLTHAFDTFTPVTAKVTLLNGEKRERTGVIAAIDEQKVIIWDEGKGFRTTPLELVQDVALAPWLINVFQEVIDRFKEAREAE